MLWKVGLKEQRERKNKIKVTQELVERKVKKKKKYRKHKQEKKKVTYTNEERRENSKVKEYEKLGMMKRETVEDLADISRRAKKSLKYTKIYLT